MDNKNDSLIDELRQIAARLEQIAAGLAAASEADADIRCGEDDPDEIDAQFEDLRPLDDIAEPAAEPAAMPVSEATPVPPEPAAEGSQAIRLSLNDRYLFQRELFDNSPVRMAMTLERLERMDTPAEVTGYLVNDLNMDLDYPVVKNFIAAVCRRFESRPPLLG